MLDLHQARWMLRNKQNHCFCIIIDSCYSTMSDLIALVPLGCTLQSLQPLVCLFVFNEGFVNKLAWVSLDMMKGPLFAGDNHGDATAEEGTVNKRRQLKSFPDPFDWNWNIWPPWTTGLEYWVHRNQVDCPIRVCVERGLSKSTTVEGNVDGGKSGLWPDSFRGKEEGRNTTKWQLDSHKKNKKLNKMKDDMRVRILNTEFRSLLQLQTNICRTQELFLLIVISTRIPLFGKYIPNPFPVVPIAWILGNNGETTLPHFIFSFSLREGRKELWVQIRKSEKRVKV